MTSIPSSIWVSSGLASIVGISAIILSIQRGLYHKRRLAQEEGSISLSNTLSHVKEDYKRDPSVPFDDSNRLTRITYCTLFLTVLAALDLQTAVELVEGQRANVYHIISSVIVFVAWLYASVLALLSRRYRLPNTWGWVLNCHLFTIYCFACLYALYQFWNSVILPSSTMNWLECLPYLLFVLFSIDLVFVTGTANQGPPFLDENGRQVCNVNVSSIIGHIIFQWTTPIVKNIVSKGAEVTDADLPPLPPAFRAHNIFYIFGESRGKSSLLVRLIKGNAFAFTLQVFYCTIAAGLYYAPAFFMNRLLQYLQDLSDGKPVEHGVKYGILVVIGMGAAILLLSFVNGQVWYFSSCVLQARVRTMLNVEIYRKSLRRRDLSVASKSEDVETEEEEDDELKASTTGAIINLMGTDSSRITDFSALWWSVISAPLELTVGFYFIYQIMGPSCFYGLLVMVILLPINHYNADLFAKTQDRLMEARDKRVSLVTEVLQGIRQIKFFAWETKWEEKIMEARNAELHQLAITYMNEVLFSLIWQGAPIIVTLVSFYSFTKWEGKELNAPIAFTVISVFAELRYALNVIPEAFIDGIQTFSSLKRIQNFLDEDEIESAAPQDTRNTIQVGFDKATIGWKMPSEDVEVAEGESSFILKNIEAHFPNHELSLISGSTGSGKTLLLLGLLGEAVLIDGHVSCPRVPLAETIYSEFDPISDEINLNDWILDRSLAYVSQSPWLQNASIRNNILFGLPYIESRYKETLSACALDKDLHIFEDGDRTEIGEKGITLSGGQKARVALARAVYSRAGIVLMDDVLSAVDAHTAKHLYANCLTGPLMKNRTRILVTHHIKLCLKGCSLLVHIDGGRAALVGSPNELRQAGKLNKIIEEDDDVEEEEEMADEQTVIDTSLDATTVKKGEEKAARVLIEEENRATGSVKLRLYMIYFRMAGSVAFWVVMTAIVIAARSLELGESYWVKVWAQSYDNYSNENDKINSTLASFATGLASRSFSFAQMALSAQPSVDNAVSTLDKPVHSTPPDGVVHLNYYLGIYSLITCSNVIVGAMRYGYLYWGVLGANRKLFKELIHRVFRAPLRFFDTTPMGRILNRFSKDFEAVDSKIPTDLMAFVIQWFMIITAALFVSWILPVFMIPVIAIGIINFLVGMDYINTSRELKRIDSVTRSPVFSHFTETIAGVTTIRAYGASQQFLQVMMEYIDANVRPFFYTWQSNRWISLRYAFTSAAVNFTACAIILYFSGRIDVPLAGLGLSFVLMFTDNMFWGIRQYTGLEMSFNSVERIVEFMEMDQEAPAITDLRPPPQWPTRGKIEVRNLEVRYAADLDPVLHDLSFTVKPQEKIGVVGRTGSGKSTLALSFFRFVEASQGSIVIDDIDIKDLGTEDLRSNLTIIPQDPTLFSGSLRSNMDPFDQFEDQDVFAALHRVHLIRSSAESSIHSNDEEDINVNVFKDLSTSVSEGGKNFSQGQRQLLCLARALLKRSRVVLMDEATASVDFETDKAIQKTISTEFSDSTILCIAHRLHTVIEYDRILLLDQGRILEFDNPLMLLKNTDSSFYKMCRNSGEFDSLMELAIEKHQLVDA